MTVNLTHWYGRLGNNIQQCAVGTMVAEILKNSFESIDHAIIKKHKTTFGSSTEEVSSKWFYWEGPYKEVAIPPEYIYANMRRICKTFISPQLQVPRVDVPDDCIVIHIRSGDIFDQVHPNGHQYTPAPLDFYRELLSGFPKAIVVTEPDNNNPIVDILRRDPKVTVQSKSVEEDFATLMGATHLANSGVGTFAIAAALCSDKVKNFYCTDLRLTEHLNYIMMVNTDINVNVLKLNDYLQPGDWKNTDEHRDLLLNFVL
jgi:hypothetical protein|tara:strand:+ start:11921 stop:12697 length:777 start_codon:yes stop_codon:yes gene_type:complete